MAKLNVKRASAASGDKNESRGKPFVQTQKRQGYDTKNYLQFGGGSTPGTQSRALPNQTATGKGRVTASGSGPRRNLAKNDLFALEAKNQDNQKPPRLTVAQMADGDKRVADYYANKIKNDNKKRDKDRLGRAYNGSSTSVSTRYRGNQNT